MKYTLLAASIAAISSAHGVIVLSEANFDGTNTLNAGGGGATVTVSNGNAPAGSNGEVGIIDSGGTGVWGATQNAGNAGLLGLPAGVVAGVDTFTATFRVYIPSTTTFSGTDRVNLIVRRNGTNGNGNAYPNNNQWDSLAPNMWHEITMTQTVEEFETDGTTPVTGFTPILSFYDRTDLHGAVQNTEAGSGTSAYIDDWSFSVTNSGVPEPSSSMAALLGLGLLGLRRKR